jgi:hypothetical protein
MLVVLALSSLVGILRTGGPLLRNYRTEHPQCPGAYPQKVFAASATHLFPVRMQALHLTDAVGCGTMAFVGF